MTAMPEGGLVVIAVTPFADDGTVDETGIGQLIDFYLTCGVSGVTVLGVMGEANRMTTAESRRVVELMVQAVAGRVPVMVGVTDSSLRRMRDLAEHAMTRGAAGVMVAPQPGLKGDAAVARYFSDVAAALGPDISICVQDFPKANDVHLSVLSWRMIVESCPSVVMLKAEDEPGLGKLTAIREAELGDLRRKTILTGNNGIHLVQELGRGSDGAMTGFAFPDVLAATISLFDDGKPDAAEDLYDIYLPTNRHELRMGISIRKEILRRRGALASAHARHPAAALEPVDHAELDRLLARVERASGQPISAIRKV